MRWISPAVACIAIALSGWGAAAQDGLLEKRESIYNNIFVFGDKDSVTMTFGHNKRFYTESSMKLSDPGALTVEYTRYMTLGIAYPPKLERILEIGLGGGRIGADQVVRQPARPVGREVHAERAIADRRAELERARFIRAPAQTRRSRRSVGRQNHASRHASRRYA